MSVSRVSFLTLFCLCSMIAAVQAVDPAPVSDTAVRDAVSRSLPFLEKEGVAWMKDHGCMSCHHVPLLLWSHRSAQAQGFTVDSQKLAEWDEWTRKDSLANRILFRLRNYDLGRPEAATLPLAVKDKLKPLIARPFRTEAEFLAELEPLLTDEASQEQLKAVKEARAKFLPAQASFVKTVASGDTEGAPLKFQFSVRAAQIKYMTALEKLVEARNAGMDAAGEKSNHVANKTALLLLGLAVAAIAASVLTGVLITRGIVNPLRGAVAVARKVASGNLTSEIEVRSRDETGELLQATRWQTRAHPQ
jgi:HAMP domain-containing protein